MFLFVMKQYKMIYSLWYSCSCVCVCTTIPLHFTSLCTSALGVSFSMVLMQLSVPLIPTSTCNRQTWYNGGIIDGMFCAGFAEGGKDACTVCIIIIKVVS